jgi:LysM repeat protein
MRQTGRRVATAAVGLLFSLLTVNAVYADGVSHTVRAGESLSGIAELYGVTVEVLVEINDIADRNLIFIGDVLHIPGDASSEAGGWQSYAIQPGDTLSEIALQFDVSVDELRAANGLESDLIIAGDELLIPVLSATIVIEVPRDRPQSPEIEAMIEEFAAVEGVDPGLVKALAWVESGWDQGARSPAGATGVMQLMPDTVGWLENDVFGQELNEDISVYDNIKAGVRYFRILQQQTGSAELAVVAYYQGPGVTQQGIIYGETQQYVDAVLAIKARFWP